MGSLNLAGPIAVIDVETTGLFPYRHDRVIEIAVVVVNAGGFVEREFVSLINPNRDIGPTRIHGITSEDVQQAPTFAEIAGQVLLAMNGCVAISAHNATFDRQFVNTEYSRLGISLPEFTSLCTMQLAGGGNLAGCCREFDVDYTDTAHNALGDARAAAALLVQILMDDHRYTASLRDCKPIAWPSVVSAMKPPLTRKEVRKRLNEPNAFGKRIVDRVRERGAMTELADAGMAYSALLDRVLEDRRIDETEIDALAEMAERYGLSADEMNVLHKKYVDELALAAVADGVVTEAEHRDLKLVARLLGQGSRSMETILEEAERKRVQTRNVILQAIPVADTFDGKRVCFTGELCCRYRGAEISRELAEDLAAKAGLIIESSVTKRLNLLVVADPHSQSGKAKKARQYGIRVMHEPVFWKAIGVKVD